MKPFTHEKGEPLDGVGLDLGRWWKLGEGGNFLAFGWRLGKEDTLLALGWRRRMGGVWTWLHGMHDPWGLRRSVDFHLVHLGRFDSSWPPLLLGLVKPNFSNSTTHCLTYYSRKQGLNNGPILFLFYCSLIHLFKSSYLLWPMLRVWEAHVGLGHLEWSPIGSFWTCPLLLGLLMGLGLRCMWAMDWALCMIWA